MSLPISSPSHEADILLFLWAPGNPAHVCPPVSGEQATILFCPGNPNELLALP